MTISDTDDFNDAIIPIGIQYCVNLAENYLLRRS
jgi:hypothetical protein